MIRRTTICALIMFAVCAFFAVDKANAQAVWGGTGFFADPTTRQLLGFHATRIDVELWPYYEPAVEGFLENEFRQVVDSCFKVEEIGLRADCSTQTTFQPGKTYYVISDHYLGVFIPVQPPGGGGVAYWNPFGFGFSGSSGLPDIWSFFPGFASPYYTVQFIYLGSTGWRLDFFDVPHINVMSPTSAQLDSNIELHFEGTNLGGDPSVNISGSGITKREIIFSTETRLTLNISIAANAPPGDRSVSISTRGYTSNSKTLTIGDRTPHIDSLDPTRGDAGSVVDVTIRGTNFGIGPAVNVSGGITAQVLAGSTATQINSRFTIPSGTLAGDHFVTVFSNGVNGSGFQSPGGGSATSNSVPFTVNAAAAPKITDYSPKGAPLGTSIQINVVGENFGTSRTLVIGGQGVTVVSYTPVSDPDHQIVATLEIAENAETGDHSLRVSAGGQLSNSVPFRVGSASPVITSIIPPVGTVGTTVDVVISGRGFGTDPTVGVSGSGFNITINQKNDTRIEATFQISSLAEAVVRLVTITSRGINGSGFIASPGGTQSASTAFDVKKAKVTIDSMDKQFAPSVERLNITYTIGPAGTIATFARLEIFKKGDSRNPIFVDPNIPKSGTVQYSQGSDVGWDGKDSNGNFIGPEGSPYTVKISIDDNSSFTNNKKDTQEFKIEMSVEATMPAAPPRPHASPTPGNWEKEYNVMKPWNPAATVTELDTEVTLKVKFKTKNDLFVGTAIPFKVAWSFTDPDDTSDDDNVIDTNRNQPDDNATVAQGGKRGGNSPMWKAVSGFNTTIPGQTATSDLATVGLDIGTTKIKFSSSAIGGDNYMLKARIDWPDGRNAKELAFKKWSVRKRLDFGAAYEMAGGVKLSDYISNGNVRDAFDGEGYTDYTLGSIRPFPTPTPGASPSPTPSDYLVDLSPPIPLQDPTGVNDDPNAEVPTNQQRADFAGPAGTAKENARTAITDKAQRWFDRNQGLIRAARTALLNAIQPTGSIIVGCKKYHVKYDGVAGDGRPSNAQPFYPSGIVIHRRNAQNALVTSVNIDPNADWNDVPTQAVDGFEVGGTIGGRPARFIFIFDVSQTPGRQRIVGRHEVGHASDHVLFGPPGVTDDAEKDHWTSGLMHRTADQKFPERPNGDPNLANDSILRVRGRNR